MRAQWKKNRHTPLQTPTKIHKFITEESSVLVLVLPLSLLGTIILSSFFSTYSLFFFFIRPFDDFFCVFARAFDYLLSRGIHTPNNAMAYVSNVLHIEQFFDSSDMGYCITTTR